MPNKHLFTDKNPPEIKSEENSTLFIHIQHLKTNATLIVDDTVNIQNRRSDLRQEMALERHATRRPRSQTLPNISSTQSRQCTKRIESTGSTRIKKQLRLTKSLDFEPQYRKTTKSPSRRRARSEVQNSNNKTVSFEDKKLLQRSIRNTQSLNNSGVSKGRLAEDNTSDISALDAKSRSFSMTNGEELQSIYSIVKARSLALKWYRRGSMTGRHIMRKRKKETASLPTIIDDKRNISLCKAKCSPQFAQVVHLLQDEVDLVENDLQVLSIE